jgi:glycosyltransferase involved in cell wall biosynthesis
MRVGVYFGDWSADVGGGHTFEAEIAASLASLAAESRHTFVLFSSSPEAANLHRDDRIEVARFAPRNLVERAIGMLQQESPTFHRWWKWPNRLDRVAAASGVEFMWFVGPVPVLVDLPYLTVVWDLQHRLQPWFPEVGASREWKTREAGLSWFLRRAAIIIAGTKVGQEEIERFYQVPPQRIALLPHPTPGFALDAPPSRGDEVVAKYGLPENYLFYPAQFWSHKNHANLLLAVQILRDKHQLAMPVVFVGSDKGNRTYIEDLARQLGLSAQVRFLGFVPAAELVALYRRALALVYVTFFGPENLPPLEAFALGCPVVASNVPGAQEQLGDAALLVDPCSPQEIARAVQSLWEDQALRETLREKGLERARKWTGRHFVRGVFGLLDQFESVRRCWGR